MIRIPIPLPSWGFSYFSLVFLLDGYKQKSHDYSWLCDPCRIQTCNPHIRSVVLYSVELTDHASFRKRVQRYCFFLIWPNNLQKKCHFLRFSCFFELCMWQFACFFPSFRYSYASSLPWLPCVKKWWKITNNCVIHIFFVPLHPLWRIYETFVSLRTSIMANPHWLTDWSNIPQL